MLKHKVQPLRAAYQGSSNGPQLKREFKQWEVTESDLRYWDCKLLKLVFNLV